MGLSGPEAPSIPELVVWTIRSKLACRIISEILKGCRSAAHIRRKSFRL